MPTRLIRLSDGVLVEVDAPPQAFQDIAAGAAVAVADAAIGTATDSLVKVCSALADAVRTISSKVDVTSVEAEVGLAFEVEGNLYITKSKGKASIRVKVKMGVPAA